MLTDFKIFLKHNYYHIYSASLEQDFTEGEMGECYAFKKYFSFDKFKEIFATEKRDLIKEFLQTK